ncbi:MAG: radical SAM protein [Candidatus Heimdallarchaeaceae archaeon]
MTNGLREADYYEVVDEENNIVRCTLCPLLCELRPNEKGKCKARMNIGGKLYSLIYGFVTMKIDHIEKQGFYHFLPGARVQTFATYNCNLDCIFCPVADKSQIDPEKIVGKQYPPDQAVMFGLASGSKIICFGDGEPLIAFEWVRETAKLAKERGLKVVIKTNGYFNEEPIREILEYVDGVMIEMKGVTEDDYIKNCTRGGPEPVKSTIKVIHSAEKHIEISLILHEELGNDAASAEVLANWIVNELSKDVPFHLTRLLPAYKTMQLQPTSQKLLEEAYDVAKESGLHYIYLDNVPGHKYANTYCPHCGEELITRTAFSTEVRRVSLQGQCNKCQAQTSIIMK